MNKLTLLSVPFFALASVAATAGEPVDPGLTALVAEHDRAWSSHDQGRQVALFTDDGCLVTPTGTRACGAAALKKVFRGDGPTSKTTSRTTIDGVQRLGGGLVLIDATQKLKGPGTRMIGTDTARVVLVAKKVKGEWKAVSVRPFPVFEKPAARTAKR